MKKSDGILSLKKAAKLLNKHAPEGESLAYINPEEGRLLKAHGGSGIMTLQGVPTYGAVWDFTKKFIPDEWHDTLETVGTGLQNVYNFLGYGDQQVPDPNDPTGKKTITQPGRSIVNDALSVWGALEAKRQQEGLNASEQAEYDRLMNQMTAMTQQFESDVGATPITPKNIPTTIEDVSTFTETTGIPDMITTAQAEGGRIGYFNGGIQGLMPQQGPAGFMPQQGMMPQQGLMPRPGFAFGTEVVEDTTVTEDIFSQVPPEMKMADLDNLPEFFLIELEELIEGYLEDVGERPRTINDIEKWYRHKGQSVSADERPYDEYRLDELKNQRLPEPPEWYNKEIEMAAQGGRIGAQGGGIMPLLNLGGMEKDYRQDGGFVPIGRKEKADDVPARLSKNEFVFTADAVKSSWRRRH